MILLLHVAMPVAENDIFFFKIKISVNVIVL